MRESLSFGEVDAISCTIGNGSEKIATIASDSDGSDWFSGVARGLLGKDAGLHLHYITGSPESSCYKYAAKEASSRRQPPGYLIVQTLRSKGGWQWLSAYMDGCDAQWWLELQRAKRIADAISKVG